MKPLKILLVNEEGCFAPGIIALAKVLSAQHRVVIAAPINQLSGVGHTLTNGNAPIRVRQYFTQLSKVKIFAVSGTSCDCVTLAMDKLLKSKPDIIISGIDSANNRGETMLSSGVVSAAIQGTIQGIPSIALSANLENANGEQEFRKVASVFAKHLPDFMRLIKQGAVTLNVNFPTDFSKRRIKYTHATDGLIDNKYYSEGNSFGLFYYWLKTPRMGFGLEALDQKGDLYWLKKNFITVTPLKLDMTCYKSIPILEKALGLSSPLTIATHPKSIKSGT